MKSDEIRDWVEGIVEIPESWKISDDNLQIVFGESGPSLHLSGEDLQDLVNNSFPNLPSARLVANCGIELPGYAEYLIQVEGWGLWPTKQPLRFKVGEISIRAGAISPGMALVFESIYRSRDYLQLEFLDSYATIQILDSAVPKKDATVALFYLNSHYLRALKSSAYIHHLIDPNGPEPFPYIEPEKIVRRRVRSRKPIWPLEPVLLYNEAAAEFGDMRFLGFYRVLEFFFRRGAVADFGKLRIDPAVTDEDLLRASRLEKELPQLQALVRFALTKGEGAKLIDHVTHRKLAPVTTLETLASALYGYRNTLVHAKESEISHAKVPDPFAVNDSRGSWAWVAEIIAEKSIRRLGEAPGT